MGRPHDGERGSEGGVAADHGRPNQLGAPTLLLGTGVANDQEDAHQGYGDRRGGEQLVRRHRPERVVVGAVSGPDEEPGDPAVEHRGSRRPVSGRGIRRREAGDGSQDREADREDPHGDAHAVAAQGEPDQSSGSRQGRHRDPVSAVSGSSAASPP
jgi:hypothetical protein